MPELTDIINDVPQELLAGEDSDNDQTTDADATDDDAAEDDDSASADASTDDSSEDSEDSADDTEEDDSDYITDIEDEPVAPSKPTTNQQPPVTDENTYILNGLSKISVNVIIPGEKEGDSDQVKTVEVYGYGDLPRNMKGFATPYEQGLFSQAVMAQENKAQALQKEYRQKQMEADTESYVKRENRAIADDLTDLRKEGIFPKFKGTPGTKEFDSSDGAKEFDRVINFMNEQNDEYARLAREEGKAYRHIGFREAFVMLNGPNPRAAEQSADKARKQAAKKLVSGRGAKVGDKTVSTKRVDNITDLAGEFSQFVGQGGGSNA